jgi:hypothetical protein
LRSLGEEELSLVEEFRRGGVELRSLVEEELS